MKVVLASAHRYADLARLWYRFVARDLVPALRAAGADVAVLVFRDAQPASFDPRDFHGATLLAPGPGARDFLRRRADEVARLAEKKVEIPHRPERRVRIVEERERRAFERDDLDTPGAKRVNRAQERFEKAAGAGGGEKIF